MHQPVDNYILIIFIKESKQSWHTKLWVVTDYMKAATTEAATLNLDHVFCLLKIMRVAH